MFDLQGFVVFSILLSAAREGFEPNFYLAYFQ